MGKYEIVYSKAPTTVKVSRPSDIRKYSKVVQRETFDGTKADAERHALFTAAMMGWRAEVHEA